MPKVVSLGLQLLLNIGYLCDDLGGGGGGRRVSRDSVLAILDTIRIRGGGLGALDKGVSFLKSRGWARGLG